MKGHSVSFGNILLSCIRLFVGAVFVAAGILKIADVSSFQLTLINIKLFYFPVVRLLSFLVPVAEVVLGMLLIMGLFSRFAAVHLNALLVAFSFVTIYAVKAKTNGGCGCFGTYLDLPFDIWHLFFQFILFALNVLIILDKRRVLSLESLLKKKHT